MPVVYESAKLKSWASIYDAETILQAERAARLPIVYRHAALMPDAHVGKGATVGSVIPTEGAIIPAAVGVDIGCFSGKTRVPLLDGTQRSLKDLAESGGFHWVYSLDESLQIVPGRATATLTRHDAALARVTVSGGDEIICTPDHLFMMNDGTYCEAKDLRFNQSLMPLYRRWQARDGYESVSTGRRDSRQTHIRVYEALHGTPPDDCVVHHRDHVHFNNAPENLEVLEKSEHSRHHALTRGGFDNASPAFRARRLTGIHASMQSPERHAQMVAVGTANINRYMDEQPEHFRQAVAENGRRGAGYLARYNTSPLDCNECGEEQANPSVLRWHTEREHSEHSNHKVVSVDVLAKRADVYCLQVEKYHNFALAAGVFVHNCGMIASQTTLTAADLPDDLGPLLSLIESRIPAGVGQGHDRYTAGVMKQIGQPGSDLTGKQQETMWSQFGTLGSGNHFVEVCLDEADRVWTVLHSGSRGIGNQLANIHIKLAKTQHQALEDPDLAYFLEGTPEFWAYIRDMLWAQEYAFGSRAKMASALNRSLFEVCDHGQVFDVTNCHHNFTQQEEFDGKRLWITRKGAIKAYHGDRGVIPGSMGAATYIVRGKGVRDAWCSCAHGAGRRLSRSKAKRELSADSLNAAMKGTTWNADKALALVDEHPAAYKDVGQVMADQSDLVEVDHVLHQILNFKGAR